MTGRRKSHGRAPAGRQIRLERSRREGAKLVATLRCPDCRTEFDVPGRDGHQCPKCGARDAAHARRFVCVLCRKPLEEISD